jgi:lipopolysaccharide heptosyltransferase II
MEVKLLFIIFHNHIILYLLDPSNLNSILVIRLSSLGDVLLTTPLLRSLRHQYPGINIDYLVKEQYFDALKNNPHLRNIISYDLTGERVNKLKLNQYDLILDLQNNSRSKKITSGLNIPVKRFNKRNIDKFLLVNFKINNLKESEAIPVRYLKTMPGLVPDDNGPELFLTKINEQSHDTSGNIGIAPGSRHLTKMWPKEYYIELANLLVKSGYRIFLLGGKSDRKICKEMASQIENTVDVSNDDNLAETAENMKNCNLVICNDSGLMHTAAAMKIPVCVFFGSTVQEFGFTPYKTKNLILENKLLNCRPCSHIGRESCPLGHFRCMLEITPQMALERILTLLNS